MPAALAKSQTVLVVPIAAADADQKFAADRLLANQPAVAGDRVKSLGSQAFRLDYYSAKQTVEKLVSTFGG